MMNSLINRRTVRVVYAACLLSFLSAAFLVAQQPFVGPRAAGMAGAQTAVANDTTALWANPAGLGLDPRLDFDIFAVRSTRKLLCIHQFAPVADVHVNA